jgi:hypothetical protein
MAPWLAQHLVELLIAGLLGLAIYNLRRLVTEQDDHGKRITALETNRVTRDDFDELRSSLMATATQNHERVEQRLDRILERLAE